jgi:hypothetical protein
VPRGEALDDAVGNGRPEAGHDDAQGGEPALAGGGADALEGPELRGEGRLLAPVWEDGNPVWTVEDGCVVAEAPRKSGV